MDIKKLIKIIIISNYIFIFNYNISTAGILSDSITTKKIFYHDIHLGFRSTKFENPSFDNAITKRYTFIYFLNYCPNRNLSGKFYFSVNSPFFNFTWFEHTALNDNGNISISISIGYKNTYFLKFQKYGNAESGFPNDSLIYTKEYVFERNYAIKDYEFVYSPPFIKNDIFTSMFEIGLSTCKGYELKIVDPLWHSQGWYEPIIGENQVNELGYIFGVELFIKPIKFVSIRGYADYRYFKVATPLFTYGFSGGFSF